MIQEVIGSKQDQNTHFPAVDFKNGFTSTANFDVKVLITGTDGFIGAINRRLRGSGWDVVGFSNGPAAGKAHYIRALS
jgi:hypothetical protein